MGFVKKIAFNFAKKKIVEKIEEESSKRNLKEEILKSQINAINNSDVEMKTAEERRKRAEYEIAKRQKIIEENRRKKSGHITYNDYIVPSSHRTGYSSHSGNTHAVRYKDSYAKRRYDDLNAPISDLKKQFKK